MKAAEFRRHLSAFFGASVEEVDYRMRPLRGLRRVTFGGRGRHAPDMTPDDLMLMSLAMVAPRIAESGGVAIRAADLPMVPPPGGAPADLIEDGTLGGALVALSRPGAGLAVDRVEIESTGRFAWVRLAGCEPILFASPEIARDLTPENYGAFGSTAARYVAFGAGFFFFLRMALDEPDDEEGEILPD